MGQATVARMAPGTRIGPFTIGEQIGEGGVGLVYVAEQQWPIARRVALKIVKPGMDSREIIARFARRMRRLYLDDNNPLMANRFVDFDWRRDEDVFIHARYQFKGDASDPMEAYPGITYALLKRLGNEGVQTPVRIVNGVPVGTVRMHEDGKFATPSGKARFVPAPRPWPGYAAAVARQRASHRFWINNGRSNHIWQTAYHHRLIPFYRDRFPIPYVEMHAEDAKALGIASGDLVEVANDMGKVYTALFAEYGERVGV